MKNVLRRLIMISGEYFMKISVSDKCRGCGVCAILCPEVFDVFDGYVVANQERVCGNEDFCIDAALYCPQNAIILNE